MLPALMDSLEEAMARSSKLRPYREPRSGEFPNGAGFSEPGTSQHVVNAAIIDTAVMLAWLVKRELDRETNERGDWGGTTSHYPGI